MAQTDHVSLAHRIVAAGGASLVSAIVVNPLDVVKTRIQAQGAIEFSAKAAPPPETLLEKWNFAGCGPTCVRVSNPALPNTACGPACTPASLYTSTWDGLRTIARTEGFRALWRGTDVALMMSIPMVGIYLPLYDSLLVDLQRIGAGGSAPLLAGTLARTAAVFATAPFELIRTRVQAAKTPARLSIVQASPTSLSAGTALLSHIPRESTRLKTFGKLWTGVGATLARDVPFSALYWALVEPTRAALLPNGAESEGMEVAVANIIAGGASGAFAGAVTTPLDVVKTRMQISAIGAVNDGNNSAKKPNVGMVQTLRSLARGEGPVGLFSGWGARSAKAAPACAMVLSAYEMLKFVYRDG